MAKLPRDLSAEELAGKLRVLGYEPIRQTGSHVRLRTTRGGEHNLTIPAHDPLKVGTLSSILGEVAAHHGVSRDQLLRTLFG